MFDFYYSPEKYGLQKIDEVDFSDGCYQFDLVVLWRDNRTGGFLIGYDSGCSCPVPFESVSVDDLTEIDNLGALIAYLDNYKKKSYYYYSEWYPSEKTRLDAECGEMVSKYQRLVMN